MSDQTIPEKKIGGKVKAAPVVSVIMPVYNVVEFIAETLDSILVQTYQDYEIVFVNDGSPDTEELEKVLAPYFEHLIYIKQENGGTAAARNTAIKNSRGELLAFLDGDDVWLPEYLELQLKALKAKQCDAICADAEFFGDMIGDDENFMRRDPLKKAVTPESLVDETCSIITSGTVARRETILQGGLFDEELPRIGMEDFDLWFRLAKLNAKIDYQEKILLRYRIRLDSLSGSTVQRAERKVIAFDILKRKYELTGREKNVLEKCREQAFASLELEKGKLNLAKGNFSAAQKHFLEANNYYRKFKLTLLTRMLQISPRTLRRVFQTVRPAEFSFVALSEKNKKQ